MHQPVQHMNFRFPADRSKDTCTEEIKPTSDAVILGNVMFINFMTLSLIIIVLYSGTSGISQICSVI